MDTKRILDLADVIERANQVPDAPMGFGMAQYFTTRAFKVEEFGLTHDCATSGCIAGWAVAQLTPENNPERMSACEIFDTAREVLGLTARQARWLFSPDSVAAMYATPAQAARVMRRMVETGYPDWKAEFPSEDFE